MAVQAHYLHHHVRETPFLLARGGAAPESGPTAAAAMDLPQARKEAMAPPPSQQQQLPIFLDFTHGDCGGKRQREAESAMSPRLFPLQQPQAQGPKVISLAQLHKRPPTTGLRLDFDEGSEHVSSTSSASAPCLLSDELAAQRDQHRDEMGRLIHEHTERLGRALTDTRRRQYQSLLGSAARQMREKEAEASAAARRGAELEDRVARMRVEAAAWQAKALADQSTAAALHAQLQQAVRCKAEEEGRAAVAADDAGSCFVDPDMVVEIPPPVPAAAARTCRRRSASVVLLPCRHLCVCGHCEPAATPFAGAGAAVAACPMCRGAVTGTVQVFFS